MTRRTLFSSLAALPLVGGLVKANPVTSVAPAETVLEFSEKADAHAIPFFVCYAGGDMGVRGDYAEHGSPP